MEKTVVIYSAWSGAEYDGIASQKNIAFYSNYLAQKAGYKTILYTDQKSKTTLGDIPYDEIIDFNEKVLAQLPRTAWAAGKILAMSMQTGPFIHLDFDFFILNKHILETLLDKDFIVFHEEPWSRKIGARQNLYKYGTQKILNITDNIFDLNLSDESMSLNFSIFGSFKQGNSKTISKAAKSFIVKLIEKKEILESQNLTEYLEKEFGPVSKTILSIILEQIIFPNILIQKYKYQYHPILEIKSGKNLINKFKKIGLLHLWSTKTFKDVRLVIQKNVDKILKQCN